MRTRLLAAACGTILAMGGAAGPVGADPTDAARTHAEAFKRACEAGDVDAVLALYADDAWVVWPGEGQVALAKEDLSRMVRTLCVETKDARFAIEAIDARALGDDYVGVRGRWRQTYTGPGGQPVTVAIRAVEVLRKTDDGWRYVLDHASVGQPAALPIPPPLPDQPIPTAPPPNKATDFPIIE